MKLTPNVLTETPKIMRQRMFLLDECFNENIYNFNTQIEIEFYFQMTNVLTKTPTENTLPEAYRGWFRSESTCRIFIVSFPFLFRLGVYFVRIHLHLID